MSQASVSALVNAVMRGVVDTGAVNRQNMDQAVDVIRAEVKALILGAEYADARALVSEGHVHQGYAVALVVAACAAKLGKGAEA